MPNQEQMAARIAELEARLAAAEAKPTAPLTLKIAQPNKPGETFRKGGGVSLYGLARFPVTLSHKQWSRLMAFGPQIAAFLADPANLAEIERIDALNATAARQAEVSAAAAARKAAA